MQTNSNTAIKLYDDWSYELRLPPYFDKEEKSSEPAPEGGDDGNNGCTMFIILLIVIAIGHLLFDAG